LVKYNQTNYRLNRELIVTDALFATKFYIPPPLTYLVHRDRLLIRLNEGIRQGKQLTLISAPAGYGKTTLLAEWIRKSEFSAVWLSLDEGDNDPVRFLVYVISALQKIKPDIGKTTLDNLQSSQTQIYSSALAPVVNELAEITGDILIVFDDYHTIHNRAVHDALIMLMEHAPPHVHFVIASRADPLLPIARLRGRGQVTELRLDDLRFTQEEAARFLRMNPDIDLTKKDILALTNRTEGWAAGLQMAAASLEDQDDVSTFIQDFTGSNRYILDYLIEEVLESQPRTIQDFLLYTSILEHLGGSLCDAVIDQDFELPANSQTILEELEHKNLFIIPLDDRREWYRYHRLFSDLLRQRMSLFRPDLEPELHRRASNWYEEEGIIEEAIEHAIRAGDSDRAANLIEVAAEATLMQSQVSTYLNWLQQLPPEEIHNRPALSVYYSWALLWNGAPLEAIETLVSQTAQRHGHSVRALPLEAFLEIFAGDISRASSLARQAIEELPQEDRLLRSLASFILASTYLAQGESEKGIQILEDTARESQRAGNVMTAVLVLCELGDENQKHGNLHQAKRLYQQALDLATGKQGELLPVAGKALIGLGDLAREWNDFKNADHYLTNGIKLAEKWSVLGTFEGYLNLVVLRDSQGNKQEADQLLSHLRDLAYQFDASEIDDYIVDMYAARRNITYGDLEAVVEWAKIRTAPESPLDSDTLGVGELLRSRMRKYENTILARLFIAQGRYEDAINILEQPLIEAKKLDRVFLNIDAEILRAIALKKDHNNKDSLVAISTALTLAEPEGFMRVFLDHGDSIKEILEYAQAEIEDPDILTYISHLLDAYKPKFDPQKPIIKPPKREPVEPLSNRELEVLQLLPSRLSSTEMAGELSISVNTLRSHLKSIYAKLEAHSRYEAIARAKDVGLL
jgi:LuxR family maltose regulon positive regulatory protein